MTIPDPDESQLIHGKNTHPKRVPPVLTRRQIRMILGAYLLGGALAGINFTVLATSIREIVPDSSRYAQPWVTYAYLIAAMIVMLSWGSVSLPYGRSRFVVAISLFTVGSLACLMVAPHLPLLIGCRALQGLGAGGLLRLGSVVIDDVVPLRTWFRYFPCFLAVFGVAVGLGSPLGRFVAHHGSIFGITGWYWIFLINVPLVIVALVQITRVPSIPNPSPAPARVQRLYLYGAMAFASVEVSLLIPVENGARWGWTSGRTISCYAIGALAVLWFLFAAYRLRVKTAPKLPRREQL